MNAVSKVLFAMAVILFQSCDTDLVLDRSQVFEGRAWYFKDIPQFEAVINDTTAMYDVLVNARINNDYPYSNLFVLMTRISPSGDTSQVRRELTLFNPDGSPTGMRKGTVLEYRVPVIKGQVFEESGQYTFLLEQNMRNNTLPGVLDIGLAIERSGERF